MDIPFYYSSLDSSSIDDTQKTQYSTSILPGQYITTPIMDQSMDLSELNHSALSPSLSPTPSHSYQTKKKNNPSHAYSIPSTSSIPSPSSSSSSLSTHHTIPSFFTHNQQQQQKGNEKQKETSTLLGSTSMEIDPTTFEQFTSVAKNEQKQSTTSSSSSSSFNLLKLDPTLASQFGACLSSSVSKLEKKGSICETYSFLCSQRASDKDCNEALASILKKEARTWDLLDRIIKLRSSAPFSSKKDANIFSSSKKSNQEFLLECQTIKSWLEHGFEQDYLNERMESEDYVINSSFIQVLNSKLTNPSKTGFKPLSSDSKPSLSYGLMDEDANSESIFPIPNTSSPSHPSSTSFQTTSETFFMHLWHLLKTGNMDRILNHFTSPSETLFLNRFLSGIQCQSNLLQSFLRSSSSPSSSSSSSANVMNCLSDFMPYQLWKQSCRFHASQLPSTSLYERACYSYVCGYLPGLLPVSRDFTSAFLSYLQCLYLISLDMYLKEHCFDLTTVSSSMSSSSSHSSTSSYFIDSNADDFNGFPNHQTAFKDIFEHLAKHSLPSIRQEAQGFFETIQAILLTNHPIAMTDFVPWVLNQWQISSFLVPDQLRFSLHFVFTFMEWMPFNATDLSQLVRLYIHQFPSSLNSATLVPSYILTLPPQARASMYTQFMLSLDAQWNLNNTDTSTESTWTSMSYLDVAQHSGLDVTEIVSLFTDEVLASFETQLGSSSLASSSFSSWSASNSTLSKLVMVVDVLEKVNLMHPDRCKKEEVIKKTNRVCRLLLELDEFELAYNLTRRFYSPPDLLDKPRQGDSFYWWEYLDYRTYCEIMKHKPTSSASKKSVTTFMESALALIEKGDWLLFQFDSSMEFANSLTMERTTQLRKKLLNKLILSILHRLRLDLSMESYGVRLLKAMVKHPLHILDDGMSKEDLLSVTHVLSKLSYDSLFATPKESPFSKSLSYSLRSLTKEKVAKILS